MSRKQEIYAEILSWTIPTIRTGLSPYSHIIPLRMLGPSRQRLLKSYYELAQLVHNLYVSIVEEDFNDHDLYFLNIHARSFMKRNSEETCPCYNLLLYYIQELFKIVPDSMREKLEWEGPEGDYSSARPQAEGELEQERQSNG